MNSNILVYDEGAGVSGTKGYDQRPQTIQAVYRYCQRRHRQYCRSACDRLFRDKHFRNVSMFTEIAEAEKDYTRCARAYRL